MPAVIRLLSLLLALLFAGAALAQPQPADDADDDEEETPHAAPAAPAPRNLPPQDLTEPILYELLLAEIALKRGSEGLAAQIYASHKLSVLPFDTATLRSVISAALRRRNKRLAGARPSLLYRFQQAMTAATFAQAGEFETAREILEEDGPPPRRRGPQTGPS